MKLSYSRAWDDVTALFRAHADLLIAIAGVFLLLPAVAAGFLIPEPVFTTTDIPGRTRELLEHVRAHAPMTFLLSIPTALGQIAILTLLLDPSRPTVAQALKLGATLLISFILLNNILINLSVAAGLVLLLLPGLYLLGRLAPASAAMVAERQFNPLVAYARGWQVSRGNGWRIFGLIAIVMIVAWVLDLAITSVIGAIAALAFSDEVARVINILVGGVSAALVGIVVLLLTAAIYRALAERAPAPVQLNKGI